MVEQMVLVLSIYNPSFIFILFYLGLCVGMVQAKHRFQMSFKLLPVLRVLKNPERDLSGFCPGDTLIKCANYLSWLRLTLKSRDSELLLDVRAPDPHL